MDLKQFKLSSGEEIIALVLEWPEEDSLDIVIRNPLKVHSMLGPDGNFYHQLKPFMVYQFAEDNLMILNAGTIIAEGNPNKIVTKQYDRVMKDLLKKDEEPEEDPVIVDPKEIFEEEMDPKEIFELLHGRKTIH